MPDLADLYPGFASHWIDTVGRQASSRAPAAQRPAAAAAARLPADQRDVAPGGAARWPSASPWSSPTCPATAGRPCRRPTPTHAPYSKRAMANVMIEVMEALGHVRFRLAGHDRGGRVAYRLALDHPGRAGAARRARHRADLRDVARHGCAAGADRVWHWTFLAQPHPFPETLIGKDPVVLSGLEDGELDQGQGPVGVRSARARALPRASSRTRLRIHAHLRGLPRRARPPTSPPTRPTARRRTKIACPMLALWGAAGGIPSETDGPLGDLARMGDRRARACRSTAGTILAEEAPDATADALLEFFAGG